MKKLLFLLLPAFVFAQDASVEKSIFNVQAGTFGIWVNNEARLSDGVALRTEAGLDAGLFLNGIYESVGVVMAPVVTLEP